MFKKQTHNEALERIRVNYCRQCRDNEMSEALNLVKCITCRMNCIENFKGLIKDKKCVTIEKEVLPKTATPIYQ